MNSLHYSLMKAHTMLNRLILTQSQTIGLTPGQPKILEYLAKCEGVEQKTIAAHCEIEPATVGGILLRMEQSELIERKQMNGNRRSLYVFLTDKGREAAEKMEHIFTASEQIACRGLTDEEVLQLNILLEKVCESLIADRKEEK